MTLSILRLALDTAPPQESMRGLRGHGIETPNSRHSPGRMVSLLKTVVRRPD